MGIAGPVLAALLLGSFWGWCGLVCFVPFSLAGALLGCGYVVVMYVMSYLPLDLPGLPVFGFDWRLLFVIEMKYNITLRASILRLLVFLVTILDFTDETIKTVVRFRKAYQDDGTVAKKLYGDLPGKKSQSDDEQATNVD